jgi:hypothetical protein
LRLSLCQLDRRGFSIFRPAWLLVLYEHFRLNHRLGSGQINAGAFLVLLRFNGARLERLMGTRCGGSIATHIAGPFLIHGGKQLESLLYRLRRKRVDFRQWFQLFQQFSRCVNRLRLELECKVREQVRRFTAGDAYLNEIRDGAASLLRLGILRS